MKILDETTGAERSETRTEILARHTRMMEDHARSMAFLDSIHAEEPYFQKLAEENDKANRDELERQRDLGLVTEENTKRSIDDLAETIERCAALLARHHGFKDGFHRIEDRTGYNRYLRETAAGRSVESDE